MKSENLLNLRRAAEALGNLKDDTVFIGGAVLELYAPPETREESRPTEDVDAIINVLSRQEFHSFENALAAKGFQHDTSPGAPICRWRIDTLAIDIVPVDIRILGFGNPWYKDGFTHRVAAPLGDGQDIFILPPRYLLATKLSAVLDRGTADLRASHDFEDVVYLFDNCQDLIADINNAKEDLREFLRSTLAELSRRTDFREAVECALPYGMEIRATHALEKIQSIIGK